jgi:hypothetical protein
MKAIARDPEQRFQKAEELEDALVSLMQRSGEIDISHWMQQVAAAGDDLAASPTRGKSVPNIMMASPIGGASSGSKISASKVPTEEAATKVEEPATTDATKETGTGLSKTQDPLETAPKSGGNKKLIYAAAAAAVVVLGIIGASSMKSGGGDATKDNVKPPVVPATSVTVSTTTAETATTAPLPATPESATPKPDAGTAATTAPVGKPAPQPIVAAPRPTPQPTPAAQPSAKPAASTMVNGRPITTALPF